MLRYQNVAISNNSNRLQLNPEKTELLWCSTSRDQHQLGLYNRSSDDWLDDRRSRSFSPWPGHLRRFGPRDASCSRADLPGAAGWCSAVSSAVYLRRRHPVPTKTLFFILRSSACSCCQTFYYWTSRLPCCWCSHMERFTFGRYLLTPHRRCLHLSVV